jgi:gluconokinase
MSTSTTEAAQSSSSGTGTSDAGAEFARRMGKAVMLLMGVSGSGKTTIAMELQRVLGWPYIDGDDLHPPANVEKMRAGHPLTDQDRLSWLAAIARWIDERLAAGEPGIITCSDLKRAYRKITVGDRKGVILVYLHADEKVIAERINRREHQYMPASLLHSQFVTLEEPGEDEHAISVEVVRPTTEVSEIRDAFDESSICLDRGCLGFWHNTCACCTGFAGKGTGRRHYGRQNTISNQPAGGRGPGIGVSRSAATPVW